MFFQGTLIGALEQTIERNTAILWGGSPKKGTPIRVPLAKLGGKQSLFGGNTVRVVQTSQDLRYERLTSPES